MKSRVKILSAAVVIVSALVLAGCSAEAASNTGAQNAPATVLSAGDRLVDLSGKEILANKMTVSAAGTKKAMPDVAYVTVAVTTQNKAMKKAQSENREKMNALYAALKEAGLTEQDIRTASYSANPLYDYTNGSGVITGYQVTNMVELTIKDIDKVGDYIDIAAAKGANTNYSINFGLLDNSAFYNEALAEAVKKAKAKADAIAAAGGYKITGTLEISESQGYYTPPYKYSDMAESVAGAATPITAGLLEITANVTIVYQIQ